jgi:hypothetical protein
MIIVTSDGRELKKVITMHYNTEWDKFIVHYVDGSTGQISPKDIDCIEF